MAEQIWIFKAIDTIEIDVDETDENVPDLLTDTMEERFRTTSKSDGREIPFLCKHGDEKEYYAVRLYYELHEDPTREVSLTFIIRSHDTYLMGFQRRDEVWEFRWTDEAAQRVFADGTSSKKLNVYGEYHMGMGNAKPKLCPLPAARLYLQHLYDSKKLGQRRQFNGSEALRFTPIRKLVREGWLPRQQEIKSFQG